MTKFARPGSKEGDYPDWAKEAGEAALADGGVSFEDVQLAFAGHCYGDSTAGGDTRYQNTPSNADPGTPYANYGSPPNFGVDEVTDSTSAVSALAESNTGGGIVRAIVPMDKPVSMYDEMSYSDPNVTCVSGQRTPVARWALVNADTVSGGAPIFGWVLTKQQASPTSSC